MGQLVFRALFWAAMVFAFVMAIMPHGMDLTPSDKSQHMLAFAVLTALCAAGYRQIRLLTLFLGMAVFGGLIEIVQGTEWVGRDMDINDWWADLAATGAVLLVIAVVRNLLPSKTAQV